jgi:hypothetical protein
MAWKRIRLLYNTKNQGASSSLVSCAYQCTLTDPCHGGDLAIGLALIQGRLALLAFLFVTLFLFFLFFYLRQFLWKVYTKYSSIFYEKEKVDFKDSCAIIKLAVWFGVRQHRLYQKLFADQNKLDRIEVRKIIVRRYVYEKDCDSPGVSNRFELLRRMRTKSNVNRNP